MAWYGALTFNFNRWFGLTGDFSYHVGTDKSPLFVITPGGVVRSISDDDSFSYLIGPRFTYRNAKRITPLAHALFGGAHKTLSLDISGVLPVSNLGVNQTFNSFGMALGGGADVPLNKKLALRLVQAEYFFTHYGSRASHNARVSTRLVFTFGRR